MIILTGIIISVGCCYVKWLSVPGHPSFYRCTSTYDEINSMKAGRRVTVAFILGEDKEADNPYYRESTRYYATNCTEKTDLVVRLCRSLVEVKEYLRTNKPDNGLPWGTIHLISHGNQWTGLSVKVSPDSKRATAQRVVEYARSGNFLALDQMVVDAKTNIILHGCGVGNNRDLIDAIGLFFRFHAGQPMVFAPILFEYYTSIWSETNPQTERYLAQSWFVNYPTGNQPSLSNLINELREKYPDARVDWQSALARQQPRWIGDVYHYTFDVPVKWIIPVDSIPDLTDTIKKIAWLRMQQQVVSELKTLQIPLEKFRWSLRSGYTEITGELKTPAVYVKGYCTMLCVLQVLTAGQADNFVLKKPLTPELTDPRFYYRSTQTRLSGI